MSTLKFCVRHSIAVAALVALAAASTTPSQAQQQSLLAGSWSGGGTVTLKSGNIEKVRCRATFSPSGNGASMSAQCANATARVSQTAELTRVSATRYIGEFRNPEYNISGSIRITLSGNSLNASLTGGGGSASMSMNR
jgi:hypothetical protein